MYVCDFSDPVNDEVIGTHYIDLSRISNDGANGRQNYSYFFLFYQLLVIFKLHQFWGLSIDWHIHGITNTLRILPMFHLFVDSKSSPGKVKVNEQEIMF